jgi:uncharacterized protein YjbI with pentapeptide repeats
MATPKDLKQELRRRWTPDRAADAKEALENWKNPKRLAEVAFGTHEGRLDLRGLPIFTNLGGIGKKQVQAAGYEREYTFVTLDKAPEFHSVHWESIDFSFAEIDHLRIFLSEITNCLFTDATTRDWRNWGNRYTNCDFARSDIRDSSIGGASHKRRDMEYVACHWQEGKLKDAFISGATYRDCVFENVTLVDQQIRESAFIRCVFSGKLQDIMFDARINDARRPWAVQPDAVVDCDFSACTFEGVEFYGIDTRTLRLPNVGSVVPHISAIARRAMAWTESADLEDNERSYLQMYWGSYVTQLPDDAGGWMDFDFYQGRARELIDASVAGGFA